MLDGVDSGDGGVPIGNQRLVLRGGEGGEGGAIEGEARASRRWVSAVKASMAGERCV